MWTFKKFVALNEQTPSPSSVAHVIYGILSILYDFCRVIFSHVHIQHNRLAHLLAKNVISIDNFFAWIHGLHINKIIKNKQTSKPNIITQETSYVPPICFGYFLIFILWYLWSSFSFLSFFFFADKGETSTNAIFNNILKYFISFFLLLTLRYYEKPKIFKSML